ncbi:MAG: hypothetical protein H6713_19120 [Myxococcales bacterium]|nr:hypothetical protein [Myxococcales bacterium]
MPKQSRGFWRWTLAIAALLIAGSYTLLTLRPDAARALGVDTLLGVHAADDPEVVDTDWYRCALTWTRDVEDRDVLRYELDCAAKVELELRGLSVATRKRARLPRRGATSRAATGGETLDRDRPLGAAPRALATGEHVTTRGSLSGKGGGLTRPTLEVEAQLAYPAEVGPGLTGGAAELERLRADQAAHPEKYALRMRKRVY